MPNDKKPVEIDCTDAIDQLYAYIDGELGNASLLTNLEHHLEHCHSCFSRAEVERALSNRIQEAADTDIPASLQNRLRRMMEKI